MSVQSKQRQFETQFEIQAPRDAVWKAISTAEGIANWFAYHAEVVPGPGGRVLWDWPGMHEWPLRIEAWKPGEALRLSYPSQVDDGQGGKVPLFVDFELSGGGGTTTLRLVHHGFGPQASFDSEYDGISGGWPAELGSLKLYVERHLGRTRQLVHARVVGGPDADEAWRALSGPRGLNVKPSLDALKVGDCFTMAPEGADKLEGRVLTQGRKHHSLTAQIENLNDGFLLLQSEGCSGQPRVWIGLALYDRPREQVERFQSVIDGVWKRLFTAKATSSASA